MFHFDTCGCSQAETKLRGCEWKWNGSVTNAAHIKPHSVHLLSYSRLVNSVSFYQHLPQPCLHSHSAWLSLALGSNNLNWAGEEGAEAWDMVGISLSDPLNRNENMNEQLRHCHQTHMQCSYSDLELGCQIAPHFFKASAIEASSFGNSPSFSMTGNPQWSTIIQAGFFPVSFRLLNSVIAILGIKIIIFHWLKRAWCHLPPSWWAFFVCVINTYINVNKTQSFPDVDMAP